MNAERLHAIALALRGELDAKRTVETFQDLVSACQQIGQNPANANLQQTFVTARGNFYAAVSDTRSDSFGASWRQVLVEIGGADLFGARLKERVERILADNQATLLMAYQQLNGILGDLRQFQQSLTALTDAFGRFHIGSESLAPGEAEVALLIPRDAVDDKLDEFAGELQEMTFILNTFSEVATGHTDDLKIRTVSSSGLMVFLAASPVFAAMFAKAVDFIVGQYKKILEIKKLQLEIERLELPDEISERTKEHANARMGEQIEKCTVEIMQEYRAIDDGRRNELTTAVRLSLDMIANRVDRGFNFEVRIEPPKAPPKEADKEQEIKRAIQTIQAASVNMQYMKMEGPPILALPERVEVGEEDEAKRDARQKRKGARKKDDTK